MTRDLDESYLVKGCIKGDRACQKMLYERYSARMMLVCLRYSSNRADAQDILQEGFIRVFEKIHTYRHEGSLEGWIRKVIVNLALRNYHNTKNLYIVDDPVSGDEDIAEEADQSFPDMETLLGMIQALPDGYRLVFNLYTMEELSHREIAQKLRISEGTSKSQLARAKALLRKMINEYNINLCNEKVTE